MATMSTCLTAAGITDAGLLRDHNEDSYRINEELGLLLVADGMGGHDVGEVASLNVVDAIEGYLSKHIDSLPTLTGKEKEVLVEQAVTHANTVVNRLNREDNLVDGTGMGSTIVGVWYSACNKETAIFNVGDSRIYRFRDGTLQQLTRDHTHYQEWLDRGTVGPPPRKNLISQALGPWPTVQVDIMTESPSNDDIYLLCSDGLTDMLDDSEIEAVLMRDGNINDKSRQLVDEAIGKGGRDNITVVLGEV